MQSLVLVFLLPIMLFNFGAGIVGFIWLLFTGGWPAAVSGFIALLIGPFAIGIAMIPGMAIAAPAIVTATQGRKMGPFSWLSMVGSLVWTYAVLATWCIGTFVILLNEFEGSLIARMLWAYAVATGPWTYMAQKEAADDRGSHAPVTAFFAQLGCISMLASVWLGDGFQTAFGLAAFFLPWLAIAVCVQGFFVWASNEESKAWS